MCVIVCVFVSLCVSLCVGVCHCVCPLAGTATRALSGEQRQPYHPLPTTTTTGRHNHHSHLQVSPPDLSVLFISSCMHIKHYIPALIIDVKPLRAEWCPGLSNTRTTPSNGYLPATKARITQMRLGTLLKCWLGTRQFGATNFRWTIHSHKLSP